MVGGSGAAGVHAESSTKHMSKKSSGKNAKDYSSGESKPATASSTTKTTTSLSRSLSSVGKRIRVYRNGDVFFKGLKVVINTRQINSIQAFLDVINDRIGLTYGAKRLYTLNGHMVKSMTEIENDKEYVAASSGFTLVNYGHARSTIPNQETAKHPARVSRSIEPRRDKTESTTTRRSGSMAPPARRKAENVQQNGGDPNPATNKKLVKRRSSSKPVDARRESLAKVKPAETEPIPDPTRKKKKKLVKKKVKVRDDEKKPSSPREDSLSPASTITRAHSIIEHISVAERVSTPLPVKKEPDSGDETHDSVPSSTVDSREGTVHQNDANDKSSRPCSKNNEEEQTTVFKTAVQDGDSNWNDGDNDNKEQIETGKEGSEKVSEHGENAECSIEHLLEQGGEEKVEEVEAHNSEEDDHESADEEKQINDKETTGIQNAEDGQPPEGK